MSTSKNFTQRSRCRDDSAGQGARTREVPLLLPSLYAASERSASEDEAREAKENDGDPIDQFCTLSPKRLELIDSLLITRQGAAR
jgi:hypothetical protein